MRDFLAEIEQAKKETVEIKRKAFVNTHERQPTDAEITPKTRRNKLLSLGGLR